MNMPRVSVVMPVYNRDWCVAEAIDSVLATGEPGLQLVIVDDGSTDTTPAILAQYAAREPDRIRLLNHPGRANRGIARSRNLGIESSAGEFVAFLDSDDLYLPHRFLRCLPWLEQHTEFAGCIEPYMLEPLTEPTSARLEKHLTEVPAAGNGWMRAMLFANTCWNTPTLTIRRKDVMEHGGFDERLSVGEDTSLWLRLAATQVIGVAQTKAAVARVRRHDSHSWNHSTRPFESASYLNILINTLRWVEERTDVAPAATQALAEKLRTFLIEILCNSELPLPFRVRAWSKAILACPRLAVEPLVAANLVRAPFRRSQKAFS
jgi:glycosyltransferase involved in cell wall biosynthesis